MHHFPFKEIFHRASPGRPQRAAGPWDPRLRWPKGWRHPKIPPTMLQPEVTAPTCFEIQNKRKKQLCSIFHQYTRQSESNSMVMQTIQFMSNAVWEAPLGAKASFLFSFVVFVFLIYFRFNLLFTSPAAFFCLWVCRCLWMSPSGPLSFPHTEPSSVTSKEDTAKANNNKWVK